MHDFIYSFFGKENIQRIEPIPQAGSDRTYTRIILVDNKTYIACQNSNIPENETYFYFTEIFLKKNIAVARIHAISEDRTQYILDDLGNETLLDIVLKNNDENDIENLYKKALSGLLQIQIEAAKEIDFEKCFASTQFDSYQVSADLNYFKYYFLDLHGVNYDKAVLQQEITKFANEISSTDNSYFMYRDFQGRNIMIKNNEPYFIDYQGGMKGPLQYDIASLLWQAKANLSAEQKLSFYDFYKQKLRDYIAFNQTEFDTNYYKIVLVRLLQVLGAYGLRGIIEQKQHFISSIPYGIKNLQEWVSQYAGSLEQYPTLSQVIKNLLQSENIKKYMTEKSETKSPLQVVVQSFSYKKGIPEDVSGNGGGFMFDCRGLLNPGRFEEYKKLTGRDKPVIDFLESKTKINEFLNHAKKLVDISVQDYIARNFENLQISFGCTGGQHRSVYCADSMAKYLKEKYNIEVTVKHLIQDDKNWIN